jgi:hypothetical protein
MNGYSHDHRSSRLPTRAFPRWVYAFGGVVDAVAGWRRHRFWFGAGVLVVATLGAATCGLDEAFANASTIPERQADVRTVLGYGPTEAFQYEGGKWGLGVLELIVDEHVGNPDVAIAQIQPRATTVRLAVHNGNGIEWNYGATTGRTIAQTYQWVSPDWLAWYTATYPPCVSPDQAHRAAILDEYTCLTETELVGVPERVVEMAVWAKPDWPVVRRLQALHGAQGLPVVTWSGPIYAVEDETGTNLPTTARWWVYYQFVAPRTPGWAPPAPVAGEP